MMRKECENTSKKNINLFNYRRVVLNEENYHYTIAVQTLLNKQVKKGLSHYPNSISEISMVIANKLQCINKSLIKRNDLKQIEVSTFSSFKLLC